MRDILSLASVEIKTFAEKRERKLRPADKDGHQKLPQPYFLIILPGAPFVPFNSFSTGD